jgi:hypothetical protein
MSKHICDYLIVDFVNGFLRYLSLTLMFFKPTLVFRSLLNISSSSAQAVEHKLKLSSSLMSIYICDYLFNEFVDVFVLLRSDFDVLQTQFCF